METRLNNKYHGFINALNENHSNQSLAAFCQKSSSTDVYLSEISKKDKPWDKHRRNADAIANHYRSDSDYDKYATRIDFCSQLLSFNRNDDGKLKLSGARFCRVRHCPVCQWRRSLMWKAKAFKILPKIVERYPKHRWLFLTLTVRNCAIEDLRETLKWMNKAWQRMSQLKKFSAEGWIRSTEVTRGKDRSAHPHFHCLLLVPSSYFGRGYLKHKDWVKMWAGSLRVDYKVVLDIRPVKKGEQPMQLVPELLKYCVKESDLVGDREWFLELTKQMHKMRCVVTGGVLKGYLKDLDNEPIDLIGDDGISSTEQKQEELLFAWEKPEKRYKKLNL